MRLKIVSNTIKLITALGSIKMNEETIQPDRGTNLRKNGNKELKLVLDHESLKKIFLVNGTSFFTQHF